MGASAVTEAASRRTSLLNVLGAGAGDVLLVLDDFHEVSGSPVATLMEALLR